MSDNVVIDAIVGVVGTGAADWTCGDSDCHHVNFARRTKCNRCQRERSPELSGGSSKKKLGTEIGKAAAEKSRGLFSAEDWQCSKCANVNWARRQTCNMCNAPKFTDVEERTGYGGGYNDRGVVEYKEREESDSEYDEFGRLKKRKKNSTPNNLIGLKDPKKEKLNTIVKKHVTQEDDDDDDEEEEEDDDSGDLSKYDLWGDEDDNDKGGDGENYNNVDGDQDIKPNIKMEKTAHKNTNAVTSSTDGKKKKKNPSTSHSPSRSRSTSTSSSSSSSSTSSSSSSTTIASSSSSSKSRSHTKPIRPLSSSGSTDNNAGSFRKTAVDRFHDSKSRSPRGSRHSSQSSSSRNRKRSRSRSLSIGKRRR